MAYLRGHIIEALNQHFDAIRGARPFPRDAFAYNYDAIQATPAANISSGGQATPAAGISSGGQATPAAGSSSGGQARPGADICSGGYYGKEKNHQQWLKTQLESVRVSIKDICS